MCAISCSIDAHVWYDMFLQDTLDAVETLLKKHEAFERAAATQEERFHALETITTVSCDALLLCAEILLECFV